MECMAGFESRGRRSLRNLLQRRAPARTWRNHLLHLHNYAMTPDK